MFSCAKMLCFLHFAKNTAFLHSLCFLQSKKHSILPLSNILVCFAKMHLMRTFCFALQKCIFASNAFLHQQNVTNAFDAKMHFCNAYIFQRKMFSITFSKGKCSAPTKCKGSIFVFCKAKNTAFLHQQNVMQKYIFAKHQIHFCIKCICNILLC